MNGNLTFGHLICHLGWNLMGALFSEAKSALFNSWGFSLLDGISWGFALGNTSRIVCCFGSMLVQCWLHFRICSSMLVPFWQRFGGSYKELGLVITSAEPGACGAHLGV